MERKNVEPKRIMEMEIANPQIELDLKQKKKESQSFISSIDRGIRFYLLIRDILLGDYLLLNLMS